MDKEKYKKWYNLARLSINDNFLIPERLGEEIISFVSAGEWLGFADKDTSSLEKLENSDKPNIFFTIEDDNTGIIGLTFNNVRAADKIKNILNEYCKVQKEELIKKLMSLDSSWKTIVYRKIKVSYEAGGDYKEVLNEQSNKIDEKIIIAIIKSIEEIRKNGIKNPITKRNYPSETPSINLMESTFNLSEDEFKKRIISAFDVLRICLDVKTDSQIRRLEKEKSKYKPPEELTKLWKR